MVCPKCKSENCEVMMLEKKSKTSNKDTNGLRKIGRVAAQVSTLGAYGMVFGKKKQGFESKKDYEKRVLCKNCGNDRAIK